GREPPDPRGLRANETLLSVSATARVETVPDQAMFTAGLSSIAPNAQAASGRNAEIMNRITAALAGLKIPPRDIQTRDLSLTRIDYGANRGRYEASNTVAVRVRDVARAGAAIAAVTAAGANIVSGPNLSVSDPEKASLGAYGRAYRIARAKAEAYAGAAGLKVARVLAIRDGGDGSPMQPMMQMEQGFDRAAPQAVAPPVMAGTSTGIVSTSVEFALSPR
ncbi:MAG: SIMPL domain-containing protein, partial [Sphingomonas sp.]